MMMPVLVTLTTLFLPSLPQARIQRVPLSGDQALYSCTEVVDRLIAFQEIASNHDQSVVGYTTQVAGVLSDWYIRLQPLEGKADPLPTDLFYPIKDGAAQMADVNDAVMGNSGMLAVEMDRLIRSVEFCVIK